MQALILTAQDHGEEDRKCSNIGNLAIENGRRKQNAVDDGQELKKYFLLSRESLERIHVQEKR